MPKKKAATKAASQSTPTKKNKAVKKKAVKKKAATKKAAAKKTVKKTAATKTAAKKVAAKVAAKVAVKKVAPAVPPAASSGASPSGDSNARVTATTKVAVQLGKHPAKTFPEGASPSDFKCYGPPATKDGEFSDVMICDMGCFTQDGKDSNKYYHGAVVQHQSSANWYAYFEWGRTGASSPSFQFVGCSDEAHARREFARQLHSKNDGRGEWATVAGIRTLRARKGKDCYLVRPMATRSTGLPDARSIKRNEGAKAPAAEKKSTTGARQKPRFDPQTMSLLQDSSVATIAYTRGAMADESLPTQQAIEEARSLLGEAQKRLAKIGDEMKKQVRDKQLMELTTLMYGRIPKRKPVGAPPETWVLSKDNILGWQNDLDAFETALYATDMDHDASAPVDPFPGLKLHLEWISPTSDRGKFLHQWWPAATANRHGHIGKMKIKNLWLVEREGDQDGIGRSQDEVLNDRPKIEERPLFQPARRDDLASGDAAQYEQTNTALLFHGTRSVNVSGIIRESLRLPKTLVGVVITGAMFGPGLYFADDWKKSAGYTSMRGSYWSGGGGAVRGREAFMFACDVVLGSPFAAPKWGPYTAPPRGHHSVFGKAGHSGVQNNEFIVYKAPQNRLRYLAEFDASR